MGARHTRLAAALAAAWEAEVVSARTLTELAERVSDPRVGARLRVLAAFCRAHASRLLARLAALGRGPLPVPPEYLIEVDDVGQALRREVRPVPRGSRGSHVEIDLRRDLIMFVTGDRLRYVVNTSTGGGFTYVSNGVTSIAATPTGRFRVYKEVNGLRISPLGELWRPKFFHGGYAIHGSASVPPYPASHGCVRVSNEAMNWIWSHGLLPMGMTVWIYR